MLKGHQMLQLMLMLGCCALAMAKPPAAVKQEAKSQLKAGDSESDTSFKSRPGRGLSL